MEQLNTQPTIDIHELSESDREMFSIKYDKPLMDIAGNTLDVKMTMNNYDPQADRLVASFLDKKIPQYLPPAEHKEPMVFKFDNQADFEACLPRHTPKLREIKPRDVTFHHRLISTETATPHTEQQPSPPKLHRSQTSNVQPVLRTL